MTSSIKLIKHNDKEHSFKDLVNLYLSNFDRPNHKIYRNVIRKVKRKFFRQKNAQLRDQLLEKFNKIKEIDSEYKKLLEEAELKKQEEIENEKKLKEKEHEIWLERERLAQIKWQEKKDKLEKERLKQQEILSKEADLLMKNNNEMTKNKFQKNDNVNENNSLIQTHNPIVSLLKTKEPEKCFYFQKTGVCKYGLRCDKVHDLCEISSILLFPNMYPGLQKLYNSLKEDYECDTSLEYEDKDIYNHFKEFYDDVLNEFKSVGSVIQFKVCCNYQLHIRGNVYVQFKSENDALKIFHKFNGRYYSGRQIYCNFVNINSWKEAICGLFLHKKCPKGRNCGFLHVFKDPDNEFRNANNDRIKIDKYQNEKHEDYNIEYKANEWSSPEIDEKNKRKRSRSRSHDSHKSSHKHKKHKKKEHKKKKHKHDKDINKKKSH